jgi:hypothetical protein
MRYDCFGMVNGGIREDGFYGASVLAFRYCSIVLFWVLFTFIYDSYLIFSIRKNLCSKFLYYYQPIQKTHLKFTFI